MSYRERKAASLGPDRTLYCVHCKSEQEVYSAAGHKEGEANLHCVVCAYFVTRLKKTKSRHPQWVIDTSVSRGAKN